MESMSKELSATRMTNYTPSHRETSSIGKRKLLTPDEVLRLNRDDALVIFRGQKVLKVKKFDFIKHPESRKMRDCNARDYIPNWRVETKKHGFIGTNGVEALVGIPSVKKELPIIAGNTAEIKDSALWENPEPRQSVQAVRRNRRSVTTETATKRTRKGGKHGKTPIIDSSQLSLEDITEPDAYTSLKLKQGCPGLQPSLPVLIDPVAGNDPGAGKEELDFLGHDGSPRSHGTIDLDDLLADL